jgi:hypothetical protein
MWTLVLAPTHPLAPCLALGFGLVLLAIGIRDGVRTGITCPEGKDPNRQIFEMAGALRLLLVGGTTLGLAAAWATGNAALAGLMLVIGLEELYETTMVRYVTRARA